MYWLFLLEFNGDNMGRKKKQILFNGNLFPDEMSVDMFKGKAPCHKCIKLKYCLGYCELCTEWKNKYYKKKS